MTTAKCKKSGRKHTPITSKAQRGAMGVAYAAKKGKISVKKLKGPAKKMYKSMPKVELARHLEESGGKKLPQYSHLAKAAERRATRIRRGRV